MDSDLTVLQARQQVERVLPLKPKSRDVNRHLEELVGGLLAIDAAVVEEDDGLGPQRCGVEIVLAAGKVQEHDAALHGLAIQRFERTLASVDQGAAHAVRPQRGRAHAIGPQAIEPLAVAALHHQFAAVIYGHGHFKCLALHVLQPQRLKPLAHVVAGLPLPRIPRHPRAKAREPKAAKRAISAAMSASSMPAAKARSCAACAGSTIRAFTGGLGAQPKKSFTARLIAPGSPKPTTAIMAAANNKKNALSSLAMKFALSVEWDERLSR